jgi:membrane protease YdiL (CAAX protease family)
MSQVPAETVGSLESIWWLLAAVVVCLPICVIVFWRIGRWWVTDLPLPLPLDRAYPAVPFPVWAGIGLFLALQFSSLVVAAGLSAAAELHFFGDAPPEATEQPILLVAQVAPLAAGLLVLRAIGRRAHRTVGLRAGNTWAGLRLGTVAFAAILPVCVAALIVSIGALRLVKGPIETHPLLEQVQETEQPWTLIVLGVQAVVLAPVVEEFLYRGVLLSALVRGTGALAALVVSSALFAIVHAPVEPQAVAPLFFLGMALGYAAYRTRSLVAPILAHALFNALMVGGTMWG